MNTNDKQKLNLIFKFVKTFQNQIRLFDYYEVDKDNLIIEME